MVDFLTIPRFFSRGARMVMIFGFNTDVKQGDTVYHVQSEARENELLFADPGLRPRPLHREACDFVRGAAIAGRFHRPDKEADSARPAPAGLDAIRDGRLENVFDKQRHARIAGCA